VCAEDRMRENFNLLMSITVFLEKCPVSDHPATPSVAVTDKSKPSDSENESVSSDEEEDGLIDFTAEEEKSFEL